MVLCDSEELAYRVVGSDAAVNEVEGPRVAFVVFGLEVVCREERRCRRGADRNVRQERVFCRMVLQLIGACMKFIKSSFREKTLYKLSF